MSRLHRTVGLMLSLAFAVPFSAHASVTGSITITGVEQTISDGTPDTGTITVTVNGIFSETVYYGQYSTPQSIASTVAAKFSLDCNSPVLAYAKGTQIFFRMKGSATTLSSIGMATTSTYGLSEASLFSSTNPNGLVGSYGTPVITGLTTTNNTVGSPLTITGLNLGPSGIVTVNGVTATQISWSPTSITVLIPAGATSGLVVVKTFGMVSNGIPLTITFPAQVSCPVI